MFLLLTVSGMLFCSTLLSGNGGSSETVNASVIVKDTVLTVVAPDDKATALTVELFSSAYKPFEDIGYRDSAGASGASVTLGAQGSGTYNLLIKLNGSEKVSFLSGINMRQGTDTTAQCVLSSPNNVKGVLQFGENQCPERYVLSIEGSPFYTMTDDSKGFMFGALPRADFMIVTYPVENRLFLKRTKFSIESEQIGKRKLRLIIP